MSNTKRRNQSIEPILEPELPICDPHHHLWDHPGSRYLLDELLEDIESGHNVVSTVFVECGSMYRARGPVEMRPVGETEFVNGIAAMSASGRYGDCRIGAGIVGFADLTLGTDVEEVLNAHIVAGNGRFRGVRHATAWHPDASIRNAHTDPPEYLLRSETFRESLEVLGRLNLTFDAWIYHHQIPDLIDLARSVPDTTIVLDHFGGPLGIGPYAGRAEQVFADWTEAIARLADCSNVLAKLGGINMKINGYGWHKRECPPSSDELVEATQRYYHRAIELFGVQRCMFESNFPMDRESCSYPVLWNAFKKMTAAFTEPERRALFLDNAQRCYRLGIAEINASS